ncbi:hypothetical protein HD806DRAFT_411094 [Xylariaceae sp. AK1471]|nr:hypothetical protein HD806DRAFT_411094 [Xylariaceae sp. AK1471]
MAKRKHQGRSRHYCIWYGYRQARHAFCYSPVATKKSRRILSGDRPCRPRWQLSECYLYFSYSDVYTLRRLNNDGDGRQEQKARQGNLLEKVIAFCNNRADCRRVEILRYFGESFPRAKCDGSCYNCEASNVLQMVDFTEYATAALKLVQHHRRLTPTQCANILMGKETKFDHKGLEMCHGIAKHITKHDIHRVLSRLTARCALKEENTIFRDSEIAIQYLRV